MVKAGQHIQRMIRPGLVPDFFLCFFNLGIDFNAISVYTLITGKAKKQSEKEEHVNEKSRTPGHVS